MACEKGAKGLGRVRPGPSRAGMGYRAPLDGLNGDTRPAPPAIALQNARVEHVGNAAGAHAKHAQGLRRRNGLAPHDIRGIKLKTISIYSNTQAKPLLPILVVVLPVGVGFFLRAKRASGPVPPLELLPRAVKLPGRRSAAILATARLYRRQANLARRAKADTCVPGSHCPSRCWPFARKIPGCPDLQASARPAPGAQPQGFHHPGAEMG